MMDFKALVNFYARALWCHRWTILGVAWGICIVGWASIVALPDQYTARARVQVDADRPLAPLLRDILGAIDPDQQMVAMRADLLSTPAMESVVQRAGILGPDATQADIRVEASAIARRVRLLVRDRNIFDISYDDTEPWRAQRIMESIVDTLVDRNVAAARRETERALRFIDTQIRSYDVRLRDAEARLAEFQRQHGGELGTSQGYTRRLEELSADEQRLKADHNAKIWQRDRLRAELHRTPEWLSEAAALGAMTPRQEYLESLRQKYAELLSKQYTDNHPDVAVLKAQIIEAEDRLGTGSPGRTNFTAAARKVPNPNYQRFQQDLLSVETQIVSAQLQREAVASSIESLRAMSSQLPEIEAQTAQLDRDYNVVRASYAKLIERREAILLAQNMAGEKTAVVFQALEKPQTSNAATGPNRPLFFTAVAAAGIGASVGYAFLKISLAGEAAGTLEGLRAIVNRPVIGIISTLRRRRPLRTATSVSAFAIAWLTLVAMFGGLVYVYFYQLTQFQPSLANLTQRSWFISTASSEPCDPNLAAITLLNPSRRAACH
jgi:polysaccharide chain length determinant protein (PEP-CTERM system associated)